ncbi:MAG: acyl-CoA dehydrogenase family protein [Alphaproteobacteria bacterium]|jgi:alkylation response protein AidB-like acyl-CoA dehydrogenase|nr:acyl-CoA dehydrogenase [Rhodospirillaceae bacterium]MDP6404939.1 acyl-CoA dehydrogenase family protein [Alphaproteobacteria bacterium]MDP6621159.1 acyl-CoA dehydrogenase family protein [Alphaproteobacteria bacterium]|tara:strand:- start:2214 stop:3458 length:1245 start_codon:yes stop_codon:yes gene_type:complete
MDFEIPQEISDKLAELDAFIESEIKPLEEANRQYFDRRREWARTDWENGGRPRAEWEEVLAEMKRRADAAGHLRFPLPRALDGQEGSNLAMAMIREHLAHKGLGLHNDLQNESSIVGNFPLVMMMWDFGTEAQKAEFLPGLITGEKRMGFGLTEPGHGSDATYMEASGRRDGDEWVIDGAKRFNSGLHDATHDLVFARTSGDQGAPRGITAFIVPTATPGFEVVEMDWTFNMPSDHALVRLEGVRIPAAAVLGEVDDGLIVAQHFLHENRIRQAASSLGAAQFCIDRSVDYAKQRTTWGKPLAVNQAIQFPLAELHTEAEMVRNLVYRTAWELDRQNHMAVTEQVAMANYRANRLVCQAADRAIQVHGGEGYTRNQPFEHIYRHHRRYRITEGAEEIQIRKIAANLFGFGRRNR